MNYPLLHITLNHFPIVLVPVGTGLFLFGVLLKKEALTKMGLGLFVLSGIFILGAYFTGERAEQGFLNVLGDKVMPDTQLYIHYHEEAAELAALAVTLLAAVSGAILWFLAKGKKMITPVWLTLGVLALLALGTVLVTAHRGGLIHHEEIRSTSSVSF